MINNCPIKIMKLETIGGYPSVKELYMGAHITNSPNYPDIGRNLDRNKYNCYFLGNFTIVTTRDIEEGEDLLVDDQYNTGESDLKPIKNTTKNTKKVTK